MSLGLWETSATWRWSIFRQLDGFCAWRQKDEQNAVLDYSSVRLFAFFMIKTIKREEEEEGEDEERRKEGGKEKTIWHGHGSSCLQVRFKNPRLHATSRATMIRFESVKRPGVYGHIRIGGETKNRFA